MNQQVAFELSDQLSGNYIQKYKELVKNRIVEDTSLFNNGDTVRDEVNNREGVIVLQPNKVVRDHQGSLVYGIKFDELEFVPIDTVNSERNYTLTKVAVR